MAKFIPPPFPKGHKFGGRKPKGARSSKVLMREAAEREAKKKLISPLEFLENVINDDKSSKGLRQDAAKASLPYRHRKMPQTYEFRSLDDLTDEELRKLLGPGAPAAPPADDEDDEEKDE
jgi:hypothetical protein